MTVALMANKLNAQSFFMELTIQILSRATALTDKAVMNSTFINYSVYK